MLRTRSPRRSGEKVDVSNPSFGPHGRIAHLLMGPAPPPQLGLSVGVTGHRADRIVDRNKVRARIEEVMASIQTVLDEITAGHLYRAGYHMPRLITALAEGADQIAAEAALNLEQTLEVVLPFRQAEYERDFAEQAAREEFRRLLGRASSVLVLDGHEHEEDRALAYEAAGMALLDNCDILIAVWDGGAGRGRGGTREVIGEAARRAMPVIIIPPDGSSITIRGGVHLGPMRFEDVPETSIEALPDIVAALVGTYGSETEEADWRKLAEMPDDPIIHGAYPLLLKLAGVRPWFKKKGSWTPPEEAPGPLADAFKWWDHAAIRAAQAFRSAVIVNFSLAALAVVLAAASVLGGDYKVYFVLAEILTIMLLLVNTWHAGRMRWQERWLESRQVAELLRVCRMLRSVGIGRGIADPGDGGSNGWYASAIARSCSLQSVELADPANAAKALIAEVEDQAGWNESTSHRMHLAAHRIERFGEVLFVIVLAAAIGWLALYLTMEDVATKLKYPLTAITAGLPAIATASYGIRIILDFEGISVRAKQISIGLNALLEQWKAVPPSSAALQEFARRAADIMLGDVAAWRLLAEGRRLTIPG